MRHECPECLSTHLRYQRRRPATENSPEEPAGQECMTCGFFMEEDQYEREAERADLIYTQFKERE